MEPGERDCEDDGLTADVGGSVAPAPVPDAEPVGDPVVLEPPLPDAAAPAGDPVVLEQPLPDAAAPAGLSEEDVNEVVSKYLYTNMLLCAGVNHIFGNAEAEVDQHML